MHLLCCTIVNLGMNLCVGNGLKNPKPLVRLLSSVLCVWKHLVLEHKTLGRVIGKFPLFVEALCSGRQDP